MTRRFGGRSAVTALEDITLAIPSGQIVSIVRPSGSGKSTLLNLLGALDRPTSGESESTATPSPRSPMMAGLG